ncbi:tRNA delta(2)-isopentenylpyrophosphate transferase [Porphyromonas crevioricanis]|uniref:tRNA dimethylallyltransferase n=2 Tax=Porphyromonas crevioricanis TaxID=393921 RepID=A0A0A2FCE1_9PORP|nr:tRNA (adenosine(37)-N6)-dimethylallyltransferase MiaA [Porphyromonas crevioricanis]KGN88701.1 tRNA delta(2)-isopentenylpyrophosphate transferase [Porphyromonas crevioricanis]KGN93929.1 tRNA delta(2)-isopentenylpyrophosphate transferase [Porphyromonas crevioricanis]SJZ89990.1 tRNA dimethylallyltransferase [Porphyromonas crevioricanis]SQH73687.1 tRNA dimethylallyltransferase [Porphyromonas crevioricanis]GAD05392.1 tRNA delta(2)-isopentenylpyrophosphate transferase [Porphyromonas crevioricanis
MITILGPTASGKTALASRLAHLLGAEIISADSRQVYRGMDLGTGKDLADYEVEGTKIPYHLIDILPAGEKYNLHCYMRDFHHAYHQIKEKGKPIILCGGTGLYIEAVLKGYHLPEVPVNPGLREKLSGLSAKELKDILASYGPLHNTTDLDTERRTIRAIEIADYIHRQKQIEEKVYPPIPSVILGTSVSRELRRSRISQRLTQRLNEGMLDEVQKLLNSGINAEDLIYYGLEYKYLTLHLIGQLPYSDMVSQLETAIHQFAKRQMTWFRGMERRGLHIHWIDASLSLAEQLEQAIELIQKNSRDA